MILEDIEKEWASDSVINPLKLDEESLKIPRLHAKYHRILTEEKIRLIKIQEKLQELEYIYEQFYSKTLTLEELQQYNLPTVLDKKYVKPEIPKAVANTKEVIEYKRKLGIQHVKLELLDSIMKSIMNRNWIIKDAITWRQFESGVK